MLCVSGLYFIAHVIVIKKHQLSREGHRGLSTLSAGNAQCVVHVT